MNSNRNGKTSNIYSAVMKISKKQLIALRGAKCEICGLTEWCGKPITFDDHHCDRNRKNGKETNRKIICPNCHRQQHLKMSDEWKKRNSITHTGTCNPMYGKHHSEETKQAISNAQKGKTKSEETKAKLRLAQLGRHPSKETKAKLNLINSGQNNSMSKTNRERRRLAL